MIKGLEKDISDILCEVLRTMVCSEIPDLKNSSFVSTGCLVLEKETPGVIRLRVELHLEQASDILT